MNVKNQPPPASPPSCLSIAGSDPSGGAGVQADLKVFQHHQVYGMAAISLLTVQNTQGVRRVDVLDPELVLAQVRAVIEDIRPDAIKTGALGNSAVIALLGDYLSTLDIPLVVDPVMISKHGAPLLEREAIRTLISALLPYAQLLMPNLPEASELLGRPLHTPNEIEAAAEDLLALGSEAVLVKGGHLKGDSVDVLLTKSCVKHFSGPRIESKNTHGTGCVLSAAVTANLAHGFELEEAIERAKHFVSEAIRSSIPLGKGIGPTNLLKRQ